MILDKIVEDKKARLIEHKNVISLTEMKKLSDETEKKSDRSFYDNLKKDGISIIGEFKKASPSLGKIESKINLTERIDEYNSSADAISCLTETAASAGTGQRHRDGQHPAAHQPGAGGRLCVQERTVDPRHPAESDGKSGPQQCRPAG